jgi:hypothetical protein
MMRIRSGKLVAVASAIGLSFSSGQAQSATGSCLSTSDTTSTKMVRFLDTLLTASTQQRQELRVSLGLSTVTIGQVAAVTADSICTRAATALNSLATQKRSTIPLYVVAVGDKFAVADTATDINGVTPLWVFDSSWNLVELLQWF